MIIPSEQRDGADDAEGRAGPEFEPVFRRRPKKRGWLWLSLASLVVVGLGIGGSWYYFTGRPATNGGSYVPVIHASLDPVKVRPENPGGMEVPNQDKLVYERLQGDRPKPHMERLLPPPEKPLPPPVLDIETAAGTPAPEKAPARRPVAATAEPAAAGAARPKPPLAHTPTTKDVLAAKKPPLPKAVELMAPRAKDAAGVKTPKDGETYKVQLAAVRSLDRVKGEWERLRSRNKELLAPLSLSVSKIDLGPKKGVFFRLRAGPLVDEAAARALCRKLVARKVGCLVVRPGR